MGLHSNFTRSIFASTKGNLLTLPSTFRYKNDNNNMNNQTLKYAYYTVKEAAEITTYNYKYLLRLINEGKLPATKPSGGKWVIKAEDLKDFMEGKL
jgi:excisionase family DNA binding protein